MSDRTLSIQMGQKSFALLTHTPNSKVFGTIQIHSDSTCFMPPVWTRINLLGREQIGTTAKIILDDAYMLSSRSSDWYRTSENAKDTYNLPFSLSIPSNIPNSFQITSGDSEDNEDSEDIMLGGVYYTIEVQVASILQPVIRPIHFHNSGFLQQENKLMKPFIPKRVFWGITKNSNHQKWQYELEFLNTFDIVTSKSGCISVKLRSMFRKTEKERSDCCLIGCQIIQVAHVKGHKDRHQILATATQLLTSPSKTWSAPCQINFEFNDAIVPTSESERACVEHCMKVTFAFCNTSCDSALDINLEFPLRFTGYTLSSLSYETPDRVNIQRSNSLSSFCSSIEEAASQDSAICISSFKSNNSIYSSS